MKVVEGVEVEAQATGTSLLGPVAAGLRDDLKVESKYLPRLKIFSAIEETEYTHIACIVSDDVHPLNTQPYLIGAIGARKAARLEVEDEKTGNKKKLYAYANGASDAKYHEYIAKGVKQGSNYNPNAGKTYLVVVQDGKKTFLATLDTYGPQVWYWEKLIAKADMADGACVRVSCLDHKVNQIPNPNDPKKKFYDNKKFTQWKQEECDPNGDFFQAAKGLMKAHADKVENWANR